MSQTQLLSIPLPAADWAGDDTIAKLFKAPSAANGGGVRILEVYVDNGAATGSGTGFSLQIENHGTAGTGIKASGGTIVAAIGGTADPFAANTPKAGSITAANAYVDSGEWVVLRKNETNSSDPTNATLYMAVAPGV